METVERVVTLPVDVDQAWALVVDADWLGADARLEPRPGSAGRVVDPDGTARGLVLDAVEVGRRLTWHWWEVEDDAAVSHVEVSLEPVEEGTRVRVVERVSAEPAAPQACARAGDAWSHRLLHLESLLLVAAAVRG